MARRGENIRKRSDGRWEGRYIKGRSADGKPYWGYVYGATYTEVRKISARKKAEYGIYNLNCTDITFSEISEQWLYSVRQGVVVLLTMIAFYATSFDSIALTASCYSYHTLEDGEQPNKGIQLMWCILLILLPIALLFAESSMNNLQSVSIVAAFPIGAVIVMIAVSFMKDAKKYMEELGNKK